MVANDVKIRMTNIYHEPGLYSRPGNRATLGLLRTYLFYCRIVGLVPVILTPQKITGSSPTIYYNDKKRCAKGPKILICTAYYTGLVKKLFAP